MMKPSLLRSVAIFALLLLCSTCQTTQVAVRQAHQSSAPYQAVRTKQHDLLHTSIQVHFDWPKQQLHGVARLKLQPHCYPQKKLVLDAQSMTIHTVDRVDQTSPTPLAYIHDGQRLTIDLGQALPAGTAYEVAIAYTTHPKPTYAAGPKRIFPGQGLYFVNPDGSDPSRPRQIWTQGQPQTTSCWVPTIDAPNQRCTQEVYITVDDQFKTLSNGILGYSKLNQDQTRTDYWHLDLPHPPYLFMLAVGDFAVVEDTWNDLEVSYYVEPSYAQHAAAIFGRTPEMIEFFSQKLNYPYPWPKYSQVVLRDYAVGAMENTSAVTFTDLVQVETRALIDKNYDDIIAHELFHHWFGNLVTCESWSHLPLNEAFACFGAHLWEEHKYGSYAGDLSIWQTREGYLQEATPKDLIRFHYHDVEEMFDAHSYNKSSLLLHMLRHYLGEEAFFKALHHYLKKNAYATVEVHQFRKALEEVTGQDLNWFFNQWFLASGHPHLKVEDTYENGTLTLRVWQKQDSAITPLYHLPLRVAIWLDETPQCQEIIVQKPYSEFTWTLPKAPQCVRLDPRCLLAGTIEHPQTLAAYQHLYNHAADFFAQREALAHCAQHVHTPIGSQVLQDALQDDFWYFRKMAVEAFASGKAPNLASVQALLPQLLQNDPHPAVRTAVLRTLQALSAKAPPTVLYKKAMADPSYQVASTALYAYATTSNDPGKQDCLAEFEASNNLDIILALARYYTATKQTDKYAWFQAKCQQWQGRLAGVSLLVPFGKYLAAIADPQCQAEGLQWLRQIALQSHAPYLRDAVKEALAPMRKVPGAIDLYKTLQTTNPVSQ